MVLHHVAQRAGFVVEAVAAFEPHGLADGDLHMVDTLRVPQRLEHRVGEAQRHQVLDRFLAQIVVDAENPVFVERAGDRIVDDARAGEIVAERLFEADPHVFARQPSRLQPADRGLEQEGRGREEDRQPARNVAELFGQMVEALDRRRVERLVLQVAEERSDLGLVLAVFGKIFFQRLARDFAIFAIAQLAARGAEDTQVFRDQSVFVQRVEGRQQHALGKIAGRAEQQQGGRGRRHLVVCSFERSGRELQCAADPGLLSQLRRDDLLP